MIPALIISVTRFESSLQYGCRCVGCILFFQAANLGLIKGFYYLIFLPTRATYRAPSYLTFTLALIWGCGVAECLNDTEAFLSLVFTCSNNSINLSQTRSLNLIIFSKRLLYSLPAPPAMLPLASISPLILHSPAPPAQHPFLSA